MEQHRAELISKSSLNNLSDAGQRLLLEEGCRSWLRSILLFSNPSLGLLHGSEVCVPEGSLAHLRASPFASPVLSNASFPSTRSSQSHLHGLHATLQQVSWETVWGGDYFISFNWARALSCLGLGRFGHFVGKGSFPSLPPLSSHFGAQDAGHCRSLEFLSRSTFLWALRTPFFCCFCPFAQRCWGFREVWTWGHFCVCIFITQPCWHCVCNWVAGRGEELDMCLWFSHLYEEENNSSVNILKILPCLSILLRHCKYIILILSS